MRFFFDKDVYNRRSIVETVNSMVKRKMGCAVNSRTGPLAGAEVMLGAIAHNIRRLFKLRPEPREVMIS